MKTIALYSIKGGVGKTATAVNLAYLAAKEGARTLLCDLDPQGAASFYFRVKPRKKFKSKNLVTGGNKVDRSIKGTDHHRLDSLPATISYRKLDLVLEDLKRPRKGLRQVMHSFRKDYDYLVLDCPPNLTRVAENVFLLSDLLLVPVIPTTLSLRTYELLRQFFKDKGYKQRKIRAFFSMVEYRKKLHRETMTSLAGHDKHFLATTIPYAVAVENMGIHREPLPCFSPRSQATRAYESLWQEVSAELDGRRARAAEA